MPFARPARRLWLAVTDSVIAMAGYIVAAYATSEVDPSVYLLYEGGLVAVAFTSLTIVAGIHFQDLYATTRLSSRVGLVLQLNWALGIAFLLQAVVDYVDSAMSLRLPVMMAGSAITLAGLCTWRLLYYKLASGAAGAERILLAGATPLMRQIGAHMQSLPRGGMTLAGYVDNELPAGTLLEGAHVLGPIDRLNEIWEEVKPDRVFADFDGDREIPAGLIKRIIAAGVAVEKPSVLYELLFRRVCTAGLRSSMVLFPDEFAPAPIHLAVQSVYNNLLALVGIALLSPVMLLIAALIKITSRGPVCEFEKVTGWKMIPFTLSRFRCTRAGGEGEPRELTPLGRWLRRLHLDTLPQLFNLLRGELAFVGPRPVGHDTAEGIVDSLPYYRLRFSVKPGLVGWSQTNSCPADRHAELEYDLYYVKHLSLTLDCYILLHGLGRLLGSHPPEDEVARRASNAG